MKMILVINIGSTSLKYALFDMAKETQLGAGLIERIGNQESPYTYTQMDRNSTKLMIDTTYGYEDAIIQMLKVLVRNDSNEEGILEDISEIKAVGFKTVHAGKLKESTILTDEV
ncbi:MAG: acetate kinase, partial [Candidatus Atribacteria bacterium]|nr:acetate kinase [Candidatus Atribacteria bacterium]